MWKERKCKWFFKKNITAPRASWTDLDKALKIILIKLENLEEVKFQCDLWGNCEFE